ncbi:hypothetical protein TNCV_3456561 [Trichonephila clavipes]|nr:hypothetical protein TNCV_3456561 [Trichonephila clavipes]
MFLAGHPSQGCFGLQSHCAPCLFFNKASFYPSDFSFNLAHTMDGLRPGHTSSASSRSRLSLNNSNNFNGQMTEKLGISDDWLHVMSVFYVQAKAYHHTRLVERQQPVYEIVIIHID